MGFGSKVNNGVDLMFAEKFVDQGPITDIPLDEGVADGIGQVLEVFRATGIG